MREGGTFRKKNNKHFFWRSYWGRRNKKNAQISRKVNEGGEMKKTFDLLILKLMMATKKTCNKT